MNTPSKKLVVSESLLVARFNGADSQDSHIILEIGVFVTVHLIFRNILEDLVEVFLAVTVAM
jgi:hypothetical protein